MHKKSMRGFSAQIIFASILLNTSIGMGYGLEFDDSKIRIKQLLENTQKENKFELEREVEITLSNIEEYIKLKNQELIISSSKVEQAKFNLKSEISTWFPNLDLTGAGLPQYLEGNTYNESSTDTSSSQFKASLSATIRWYLVNPTRIPDIETARDKLKDAELAYEIKFRDIYLQALKEFFELQKSNEEIRIARDSILTSQTSLKEAEIRLEAGIGTKFEVLEAKTQLAKDKQFLATNSGKSKINQSKLSKTLNLNRNLKPIVRSKPKILGLWDTSLSQSIISAYKFQKVLKQSLLEISINNNQANSALGSSQPKVSLFNTFSTSFSKGEVGVVDPDNDNEVFSESNTIGIQFDWKVFDGGYAKSIYNSKKERSKELKANYELKKNQILQEVKESFYNLEIAKNNITNTFNEILSAKESLRLALLRLKAGITTQREVVSNQRDLTQAEVNYIAAITDYNSNLVNLKRETGITKLQSCTELLIINKESSALNSEQKINEAANSMRLPCKELIQ